MEVEKLIQQILLTSRLEIKEIPHLSIQMRCDASSLVEGNFIDFYQNHPSSFDLVIGDVMGQGWSTVLVAAIVKAQCARFAIPMQRVQLCSQAGIWQDDLPTPAELAKFVYQEIREFISPLQHCVRLFYGRFDFPKRLFSYINCGFAKPLYYQKKTGAVQELPKQRAPLGASETESYDLSDVLFADEDFFLFYSENMVNAKAATGEVFDLEQLKQFLEKHHNLPLEALKENLEKELLHFSSRTSQKSTTMLLFIKIEKAHQASTASPQMARFCSDMTQISAVRQFVRRCFTNVPGDHEQFAQMMQLCVDEVFSNLAMHGAKNRKTGEIRIFCNCLEEGGVLEIADQGCEFDPATVTHPNFSGTQEHGFGWYILRQLADELAYIKKPSSHGWNHLKIFKKYLFHEVLMEMSYKKEGGVLVVTFDGDHLDAKNSAQSKEYVLNLIQKEQLYYLVFDLHLLKFIDSSGLGSFLAILKHLHLHQGELKLGAMGKTVRTVFELVCMHKIFDIYPTVEEAIKACQESLRKQESMK